MNRLLVVGNPEQVHVGAHLYRAGQEAGLAVELCDVRAAFAAAWPILQFNWRLRGHRAPRQKAFGRKVVETCRAFRPRWLLATGLVPLTDSVIKEITRQGVICLNYLTDDPWNPAHRATWFLRALKHYSAVFSPRRANLTDLEEAGCERVVYMPFAYAPHLHFREFLEDTDEYRRFDCDVLFYGGADADRLPYMCALLREGFRMHLYGGYWERFRETRPYARGQADPMTLRKAVAGAKVTLCLVRRANRDGHAMRTFEAPAMGACLLAEDTSEHRELLGEDGETAVYFHTVDQAVDRARWLLEHEEDRLRLAAAAHTRIVENRHTYRDRLLEMLDLRGPA